MRQLILADDNPRDRIYLAEVLSKYKPIITANAMEALEACEAYPEPWIVTDIQMPGCNGIELGKQVWSRKSLARVIFWSQYSDETYVRTLSKLIPGETVYGYVLKNNPANVLLKSAQLVFEECQCWIDPQIRIVQARTKNNCDVLSDREYEVLINIALGLTDNTIAKRCYLSRRGVQNRLQSLYSKLGANLPSSINYSESELLNVRARAVALALQRGLINAYELKIAEKEFYEWLSKY